MVLQPLKRGNFGIKLVVAAVWIVTAWRVGATAGGAVTAGCAAALQYLGHVDGVLPLCADSGILEELGESRLTGGADSHPDTHTAHKVASVGGGELGDGVVELLGAGERDVAASEAHVRIDAEGGAAFALQRDGVAHGHEVGGGLADVFDDGQRDLLRDEGVELVHLAGNVLVGGVLDYLLHGDGLRLGSDVLVAVVELDFVRNGHNALNVKRLILLLHSA